MDLRPRQKQSFSGFTKSEVEKMEKLIVDSKEEYMDEEYCKKLARLFNRSSGRAGKPAVKWTEIQSWFQKNRENCLSNESPSDATKKELVVLEAITQNKTAENAITAQGVVLEAITQNKTAENAITAQGDDSSKLEFEARSSKDGAWYDVETFLSHRFINSEEIEVLVRYVGFGAEEDEWVNVKESVRVRSIALEHYECKRIRAGYPVVCFQERQNQARYYDAHVVEVQRRLHDIRGCRCLFLIRYDHDNVEEQVRLRRLCCRADVLALLEEP